MKPLLAIVLLAIALSLCNLLGKRSHENSNATNRESGSTQENSNAAPPLQSAPPSQSRNSNTAIPRVDSSAPPAPNPKSAAAVPRAPISGGVLNGKAVSLPQPAYPPIAKASHASGTVTVQVVIDESGNVISAHPVSGHPLLQASAAAAARQAKFSPTKLSGQPVKVTGVIVYNFVEK